MSRRDDAAIGAQSLTAVLEAQRDVTRGLLGVARRQQQAIVAGDVAALTATVDEAQELFEHLQALETERMTALVAIAMATGMDVESASLSDVAALLPAEPASILQRTGQSLRADAVALQEMQRTNARLLEGSRALVDRWLHYLRGMLAGGVYTAGGGTADAAPDARALDRSA